MNEATRDVLCDARCARISEDSERIGTHNDFHCVAGALSGVLE